MLKATSPTPKELFIKRTTYKKQLKVAGDKECYVINEEKEIEPLNVKRDYAKPKLFKARDRDLKEESYRNPFALPEHLRVTSKCLPPRKLKKTPFVMDEPHTIYDIDSMFYKIVAGRPIRSFYDIKSFMTNLRDITLLRADCAYLKDKLLQIDMKMIYEKEDYDAAWLAFKKIETCFVIFARESHKEALYVQHLAQEKALQLAAMEDQLDAYSSRFHKLKNMVSVIAGTYDKLSYYKRFLYSLSPEWWREQHENILDLGGVLCSQYFCNLEAETIDYTSDYIKRTITLAGSNQKLYFKSPIELMVALENMGRQCLNYMEIETYFSTFLASVNKHRKEFTKRINDECNDIQEIMEGLTNNIRFSEDRHAEYKTTFDRLLQTEFHRLVASYESTKLFTCLQYVHTRIFGIKEDPKDSLASLTEDLERRYLELCRNMDNLNLQVVKEAQRKAFSQDIRVMRRASNAERQLKEYNVLSRALDRSFEPSKGKTRIF